MNKYTSKQNLITEGIVDKIAPADFMSCMPREFIEYQLEKRLVLAFPVQEMYSNPLGSMQGGFISAAFDHTFGSLVYLITNKLNMATIDLNVTYHRPIGIGDTLTVFADVKSLGNTIVHITGEAYDENNKLIASSSSSLMLLNKEFNAAATAGAKRLRHNSFHIVDGNKLL